MTDTLSANEIVSMHEPICAPVVPSRAIEAEGSAISVGTISHPVTGASRLTITVTGKDGTGLSAILGPDELLTFDDALYKAVLRLAAVHRAPNQPSPPATH